MEKSKVYFIKEMSADNILKIYHKLGKKLEGNVAVKLHSGEPGGHNFLQINEVEKIVKEVNGTIVECNTAYQGRRYYTEDHKKAVEEHGFTKIAKVDIMDEEEPDLVLPIYPCLQIDKNYVGNHLSNYDSMLVLTHFKGHEMGGFGGSLKNISIGIASRYGKGYIHGAGDVNHIWDCEQDKFLEAMADASKSILEFFKGEMVFINCMVRLSIDCDCNAHPHDPEMKDIGILASLDPVALDQACLDLVYSSNDSGKKSLIERIESKHGVHILEAAEKLGYGNREYELEEII